MTHKSKTPIDGYSRAAFEEELRALEKSGVPYAPRSDEREQNTDWQLLHEAATNEERSTVEKLDRLYANAHREATDEYVANELLPKIEKMKRDTEETLLRVGDNPPADLASMGHAVITEAKRARQMTTKGHFSQPGSVLFEIFKRVKEFYRRFKELVSDFFAPNRFGKDKGSSSRV